MRRQDQIETEALVGTAEQAAGSGLGGDGTGHDTLGWRLIDNEPRLPAVRTTPGQDLDRAVPGRSAGIVQGPSQGDSNQAPLQFHFRGQSGGVQIDDRRRSEGPRFDASTTSLSSVRGSKLTGGGGAEVRKVQ